MASCQKLSIILIIKWFKKCSPKLVFFNEKRIEKDWDDFWRRKLTLKVKFWQFLTPPHYTNSQNSLEISTTHITIMYIFHYLKNNNTLVTWNKGNVYCHNDHGLATSCGFGSRTLFVSASYYSRIPNRRNSSE